MLQILGGICLVVLGLCIFLVGDAPALVIIMCMVLLVLPGLWLIWDGQKIRDWEAEKKQIKADDEKKPHVDITAAEILSNILRATSLYRDRKLRVTGIVADIAKNGYDVGGGLSLTGTGKENNILYCKFAYAGSMESVSIGQTVTIEGILRTDGCYLEQCDIVSTAPSLISKLTQKANNGDSESQFVLGLLYCTGKKVKRDLDIAIIYLSEAAKQNHKSASSLLDEYKNFGVGEMMTSAFMMAEDLDL